jgi:hypothetical protein
VVSTNGGDATGEEPVNEGVPCTHGYDR